MIAPRLSQPPPIIFEVSGHLLAVSDLLWRPLLGPKPAEGFSCDGCSWSPDKLGRRKLWPACVIHDYHYRSGLLGGTWHARRLSDRRLARNLYTLLRMQGAGQTYAKLAARAYYGRVRIWGAGSYAYWDEGEKPRGFLARVREAWGSWEPTEEAVRRVGLALREG